jgi:hypothetical protein
MKYIRLLSRIVVGAVFIFSGFVKAVDPLGSAYKFADYFIAFKLGFLESLALPMSIFLSAFEMVLGITLILGYHRKIVFHVLMGFASFFTLLTLVLALFNPVSDCGCFGDALILTNWQTFLKNMGLMIFVLILWLSRNREPETAWPIREWIVIGSLFIMAALFSSWNYRHLPLMDFRPYDVGTVIRDEMEIPEGAPADQYRTTLVYRNRESGKTSSFTMEDYPKDTVQWEFVNSESKLLKKGYEPPIHDFAVIDAFGNDIVSEILSDRGYSLVMVSYDLEKADEKALVRAGEWSQLEILANDFSFYAVTATSSEEVETIFSRLELPYPFFTGDEIMLKTIIRSNPGFMLLKNGAIIGKWGYRDFPSLDQLDPQWSELIGNASVPVDEEMQMLIDAGVYNAFSFDVVEFDRFLPGLLLDNLAAAKERGVIVAFILGLVVVVLLSGYLSPLHS